MKILKTSLAITLFLCLCYATISAAAATDESGENFKFLWFLEKSQAELEHMNVFLDDVLLAFANQEYGVDTGVYRKELSRLSTNLQLRLIELEEKNRQGGKARPTIEECVRLTYHYLFSVENFRLRADSNQNRDAALFSINRILDDREGGATGLSLLVLAVSGRLSVPYLTDIAGAWTGERIVVTYESQGQRRFLEPEELGADRSQASYKIPEEAIKNGAYLQPLDLEKLIGLIAYEKARLLHREDKTMTAEKYLEASILRMPTLIEARLMIASINLGKMEMNAYGVSRRHLDKACELNPRAAGAFLLRGIAHYSSGEIDRAKEDFGTVLKIDPKNAEPLYYTGLMEYNSGNLAEAGDAFKKFLEMSVGNPALAIKREKSAFFLKEIASAVPKQELIDTKLDYKTRIAALNTLKKLKCASSVAPLIECLSDANINFRHLCAQALTHITGMDFGIDQLRWRVWWNAQKPGEYR